MTVDLDDRLPLGRLELIERLRRWFEDGRSCGARFLVVFQDVFDYLRPDYDYGLYPVFVGSEDDAAGVIAQRDPAWDRAVDVFELERGIEEQLREPSRKDYHYFR